MAPVFRLQSAVELVDVCNGGSAGDRDCLVYGEFSGDQGGIDKSDKESAVAVGVGPECRGARAAGLTASDRSRR